MCAVGEGAQFDEFFLYILCLLRKHGDARIEGVDNAKERLRDRIVDVAGNAVALGLDGEASGAVNAQDRCTKREGGLIRNRHQGILTLVGESRFFDE